jgi:hypothetical protein
MRSSAHDARKPPEAMTSAGVPGTRLALRLIGLAILGRLLRSRRFYERLATGAVVLAALRGIGQDNRAGAMARLAAWNKRQAQLLEGQAERQSKRIARTAKSPLGLTSD